MIDALDMMDCHDYFAKVVERIRLLLLLFAENPNTNNKRLFIYLKDSKYKLPVKCILIPNIPNTNTRQCLH